MLHRHVDKARALKDMSQVEHVCCDEVAVRKGHHHATVFADCQRRDVLLVTPQKDDCTWFRFGLDFKAHGGDLGKVKTATMDMSKAYQSGARAFAPKATLIFDHFHVIQLANKALDDVRRLESSASGEKNPGLKRTRYLWLRNSDDLTADAKATVKGLEQSFVATGKAYRAKLALQESYRLTDPVRARRRLQAWQRWVSWLARDNPLLKPLRRLQKTVGDHLAGILAYFDHHLTNGYMEGLMSVFSATNRKARGYRTLRNLATMLYLVGSHLNLPSQNLAGVPRPGAA
jgi:transposase